jgi:hypothetical protein
MMNTYYRKSYDVAAYNYKAETLCPDCTVAKLPTGEGEEFDGWAVAPGVRMSAEDNLSELALAFGINRNDEHTFDSDEFPKVVFVDQLEAGETCGNCGQEL